MKKLSIVIPCYNEEESIDYLYKQITPAIKELKKSYKVELILVDDGSTDNTLKLMEIYFKKEANIVTYQDNRNVGGALKEGFKHVTGDIVVTIDSDCTYPPKDIKNILKLLDDDTDIVTASPYHPDGKVENVPKYRLFLSRTISKIYGRIVGKKLYTYTSIFRAFRREVLDYVEIKSNGFIGVTEFLIFAIMKGYRVKEFPTTLHSRIYGESKIKLFKTIKEHLKLIMYILGVK